METAAKITLDLLLIALEHSPEMVELVTGSDARTIEKKIKRARENIPELLDTSGEDHVRRKRLIEILNHD